jgi:cysteinyl-tRNA synthetase
MNTSKKNNKILLYNTLSKTKEEFEPLNKNEVRMYTCGPTVYNYAHIGNYRAYVFADTLKRALAYNDYQVRHIMNITDVDDKTIRDSQKESKSLKDFTEFYTEKFFEDLKMLNVSIKAENFTKATENIDEMVRMIEKLLEKNLAYKSADKSVYFDIKKFKNYGKLSHLELDHQKENASGRIKTDEYDKENVQDFALWKAWDESDGEVYWETSLGKGRPGWHIECSAMSIKFLGEQFDIHTGGVDLIFPHHENEIAQSEGATGKEFVKYWMHNEWVLVDSKKMAKSAGNFYTLRDIIKKGLNPLSYRFWLLMASYRTRVNFVWDALEASEIALKRLYNLYLDLGEEIGQVHVEYKNKFTKYINDDLNTPRALSLLWDVMKDENISKEDKKATILDFDKVLGLGFEFIKKEKIPEEVIELLKERENARKNKDFKLSDEIREKINAMGFEVKDVEGGQRVNPRP